MTTKNYDGALKKILKIKKKKLKMCSICEVNLKNLLLHKNNMVFPILLFFFKIDPFLSKQLLENFRRESIKKY